MGQRDLLVTRAVQFAVDRSHADGFVAAGPRLLSRDLCFRPHVLKLGLRLGQGP